jgi:hypothetical protein
MAMFGNTSFKGIQFPQIDAANLQQPLPTPEPKEPSFFGQGGTGRNIAGYIGDALLTASGGRPVFGPAQMQQHQMQQQIASEERRAKLAAMYRAPQQPHYWETNDGSLGSIGPDGQPQIVYKDPTPKVDYTPVKNQDGTTTLYPTVNGQVVGPAQQQPQGAPALPQGFTVRPKGGAASGPRPFR